MKVNLPKKVKVGPFTYKIKEEVDIVNPDGDALDGKAAIRDHVIYISKDVPLQAKREILIHEILHCIWSISLAPLNEVALTEEQIVYVFSPHLLTVLQDNPDVTRFLLGDK